MSDVGDTFPHFALPDENGEVFDSKYLEGIRHIVYFYPKDCSPECTEEALGFNEIYTKLMIRNVPVIGISTDSAESHRKFMNENGLKFKLLTDADHKFMTDAGVWNDGAVRSTFVIGKDGRIEACWHNIDVKGHADTVYAAVKTLMK